MSPDPSDPEDEVRRVLADLARDDDRLRMPTHVAARLDDVVHDLATDRAARPGRHETSADRSTAGAAGRTSPGAALPRRRWPHVLVAAAAVVVVVAAGGAVLSRGGSPDSTAGGGSSSASRSGVEDRQGSSVRSPAPSAGGRAPAPAGAPQPRLRTPTLARDVQRVADDPPTPAPARNADCARPQVPAGTVMVAVRLDGRAATLVLPAAGASGEARVYSCDRAADGALRPEATTTVRKR